ncbi:MAG: suppressor of fused domain protein [Streptosporangiaceae bacterium]|nr:suppressor of fused domain protein [Streptosporangiaceae bacterium]MBV9856042.1 suppressor of fused domain protein [Streptosporangiaceae bacterium]
MRSGPPPSQQPATLLESLSPYESRRLTVESDGATTAAYLHDETSTIAATWIANHVRAPETTDTRRLDSGLAPVMPAAHTRHPRGRPPLDPATLQALWFEEGDGVAVTERGTLLAVIPGWSDMSRGMPGYCRDIIGQTPFGWSLDDAMEGLGPRVERARAYWQWRQSADGWEQFQQALLGHLTSRLGPGAHYWDASRGKRPAVGISERPPAPGRPYTVLSTVGMSCQRMPIVEQVLDDPRDYARIELAVATTLAPATAARVFLWLATYPWRAVTWFGPGHSIRWYAEPATFPLGGGFEAVLLLDDPSGLSSPSAPEVPDLSGFSAGGDPVRWLWIIPITERARLLAKDRGSSSLVNRLAVERRSWIAGE